nr:hypothetical protein [Tanacetum cinerariifolium]
MNEEKYTRPEIESNTEEDDVWYFDNGASNHMIGNYSYLSELNENKTGRVRFEDGSILFQGKNGEQKLLKDIYYIPALRSNVISLGQTTISGYDISIRGDFLTMRDSCGDLLIKVPCSANRIYKTQLKPMDGSSAGGSPLHNETVHIMVTGQNIVQDDKGASGSNDTPIPVARHETIRLLIAFVAGEGWKIYHYVKKAFLHGDLKELDSTLKEMVFYNACKKRRSIGRCLMENISLLRYRSLTRKGLGGDQAREICNEDLKRSWYERLQCNFMSNGTGTTEDEREVEATQYRKMVGCLRYLLHSRPNLTYSVSMVNRYMKSPRKSHARAMNQILRYLKGTTSFGIEYKRGNDMRLVGYSSHNVDIDDGRSTTGHVFYLATAAACQAIWLREVLAEVTGNEQVIVEHVSEENQRGADPLTKALARIRFKEMRSLLEVTYNFMKKSSMKLNESKEREKNSNGLLVLNELCNEIVEDSSAIEKDNDCVMVLDDDCKESESRVCGMEDDQIRDKKERIDLVEIIEEYSVKQYESREENNNLVVSIVLDKFVNEDAKSKEYESLSFDKRLDVGLKIQTVAEITETLLYPSLSGIGANEHKMISNEVCIQKGACFPEICRDLRYVEGSIDKEKGCNMAANDIDASNNENKGCKVVTCCDSCGNTRGRKKV